MSRLAVRGATTQDTQGVSVYKELISKNASVSELKQMGMREGMHTLRQSATMLVIKGITSVHEMIKTTFEN